MTKPAFLDDMLKHFGETTPQSDAVEYLGDKLSYSGLNAKANQIADHLTAAGVENGDRVVICAPKSLNAVAAIYAILRVGAVYVPIDPAAPSERALAQTHTVAPRVVITDSERMSGFGDQFAAFQVLGLDQELSELAPSGTTIAQSARRRTNDPAYILMTSGSTGAPKGIVHTHRSGLAYAQMAKELCNLQATDRVSNHTPLHFDMSIFDIFSTALAGGCTVVIPEMHAKFPASLAQLTEQSGITVWYSVPFALTQMVERGKLGEKDLSALRVVMFAGEMMPPATLKEFAKHTPNATFLNAYGPTETNHCITAEFSHSELDGISALPIGFADAGVTARIGEAQLETDEGELLISSDQVMREYWQDTKKTNAAFVDLPDRNGTARRFYRTGDIVTRDQKGRFVLVGRKDRQVKIRGFRVELDEIELALMNSSKVNEAAVVVVNQMIHAFVTGEKEQNLQDVQADIRSVLPQYAVPQSIDWLNVLPRTSTGKIDRTNLTERANAKYAA